MDSGTTIDALTKSGSASDTEARKRQSMEKAAEGFESFFISNMLKELAKASQLTKKSYTEETEMSIFYEKVGDYLAKRGIGIKEAIMKYLSRTG
jgi:Rod binding domain-containing protein